MAAEKATFLIVAGLAQPQIIVEIEAIAALGPDRA